jgi:hypothetical protein
VQGSNALALKKKYGVLANYIPEIGQVAKMNGIDSASKLGTEKMFVMACAMQNVEKTLRKYGISIKNPRTGVTAGLVNSVGTETSGLAGHAARFISLITADILINLTAYDHVVVFPMKARTSLFTYPQYVYGTNKGEYRQGEFMRDIWSTNRQSSTYISSIVAREGYTILTGDNEVSFEFETPNMIVGTASITVGTETATQAQDGTWTNPTAATFTVTQTDNEVTVTLAAAATADTPVQVTYAYNNETVPRPMVPTINVVLKKIQLYAEFYQIQIAYDLFADFESDNDYGFSIKTNLPEQAALEVKAEIDRLVYDKLEDLAESTTTADEVKLLTVDFTTDGVTAQFADVMKYRFGKIISRGEQTFLGRTGKQGLKNLIFGPAVLDILSAVMANVTEQADAFGPYKAGVYAGRGIYIDPYLTAEPWIDPKTQVASDTKRQSPVIFVAKSKDGKRAPLVLGEYMPIVPTAGLDLPDFTSMKGWATSCVVEVLNAVLVAYGLIVTEW